MTNKTCRLVQPELKAYLDGMLPALNAFRVRRHLAKCGTCRQALTDLERIGKELRNLETEMRAEAETLDPRLRARILAAIPAEPGRSAPIPRRSIGFRPALALGTLAAATVAAYVVYPRQNVAQSLHNETASASMKSPMHLGSDSPTASAALHANDKSINGVAGGAWRGARAPATVAGSANSFAYNSDRANAAPDAPMQVSAGGSGSIASNSPSGSPAPALESKAANGGASNSANTDFTPRGSAVDGQAAHAQTGIGGLRRGSPAAASTTTSAPAAYFGNVSPISGIHGSHSFTANNLEEGANLVRRLAASFHGNISAPTTPKRANTVELTVTIAAPHTSELLAAIPRESGGTIQALASRSKGLNRNALAQPYVQDYDEILNSGAKKIKQNTISSPGSASAKSRSARVSAGVELQGGGKAAQGKTQSGFIGNRSQPKTETITIVLVKRK